MIVATMKPRVFVVVLNWNGRELTEKCLDSLKKQSLKHEVVLVDNGSTDGSVEFLAMKFPSIKIIPESKNHGFAGGVNIGINRAIEDGAKYVALLNNDATADRDWLKILVDEIERFPSVGIVAPKLLSEDGSLIDSTGDTYSIWGLPFPRGRNRPDKGQFDHNRDVFGGSGGGSIYRVSMLQKIGLFDERFFAYYEDVDLSFRAQLAGWKVRYCPDATVFHATGSTSSKIGGFTTYQTLKNLPMLFWKNVPTKLLPKMFPRFFAAYTAIWFSSLAKGRFWPVVKSVFASTINIPYVFAARWKIQRSRKVSNEYIWSLLYKNLPPNAEKLRRLRDFFTPGRVS